MTEKELQLHNMFLDIAENISNMSHCVSYKVGAILVKDKRIISSGYNGTPAGYKNCNEIFENYSKENRENHHEFSEMFEIHAELNTILTAAKNGICINNCDIYTTLQPCNDCLKMICNSGIKNIYYRIKYDKNVINENILEMLRICNVSLIQINNIK